MKAIVILLDSLNRHFLTVYGNDWVRTPNISRLAQRSVIFQNHWLGSAPCMPARRDMFTGRLNFLERGWGGMEPFDVCLPHVLAKAGVYSHMETDHYHYCQGGGEFYHTSFTTWGIHRGQEYDPCPAVIDSSKPPDPFSIWDPAIFDRNRQLFRTVDDYPSPQTFNGAVEWLKMNEKLDNYLLWVEAFDPHGPYQCPDEYIELYESINDGLGAEGLPEEKARRFSRIRKQYAALLTLADEGVGKLLDEIERQNGFEDTLIILTTDHGHLLGEHGVVGKNIWHCWNELTLLPLIVHLPGSRNAGESRGQMTQNIDLYPTLAEFFGAATGKVPNTPEEIEYPMHGKSFLDAATGNAPGKRETALFGWYGKTVNVTDGRYTYFRGPAARDNKPLYQYFLMPTHYHHRFDRMQFQEAEFGRFLPYTDMPVMRSVGEPEFGFNDELYETRLFDIMSDPAQEHDLVGSSAEKRMEELLIQVMEEADSPPEQFERLGLR